MNKLKSYILGFAVGSGVGYFLANVIVEELFPPKWEGFAAVSEEGYAHEQEETGHDYYVRELRPKIERVLKSRNESGHKHNLETPAVMYNRIYNALRLEEVEEEEEEEVDEDTMEDYWPEGFDDEGDADRILEQEILSGDLSSIDEDDYIRLRDTSQPYLITQEEYEQNANDYKVGVLLYYMEDDVLTDARRIPLLNNKAEKLLGDLWVNFGFGSNEQNVSYICNEESEAIYQIRAIDGSYDDVVSGKNEGNKEANRNSASASPDVSHNVFDEFTDESPEEEV